MSEHRPRFTVVDPLEVLINYALNTVLGGTARLADKMQPAKLIELARACDPVLVGKVAVYAYKVGKLRDTSALLTAYISAWPELFKLVAPHTLDNVGQIRKFVHYKREGICGSKSLGTVPKTYIQNWLVRQTADDLFFQSIGSNPSLGDVIKLTHPKPPAALESTFKYFLGKTVSQAELSPSIKAYKAFIAGESDGESLPDVPVQMLEPYLSKFTPTQLVTYIGKLTPNQLRRQLELLQRTGAFSHTEYDCTSLVASKLDKLGRGKNTMLPLSLLTTINAVGPGEIKKKLAERFEDIMLSAAERLHSEITRPTAVVLDCSGSMWCSTNTQNDVSCFQVGKIFAYPLTRNKNVKFYLVNNSTKHVDVSNAKDFADFEVKVHAAGVGGGTDLGSIFPATSELDIIVISDNETWKDTYSNTVANGWNRRREANVDQMPKLVLWDIMPNRTTPALTDYSVLNVGGLSEGIYDTIANFWGSLSLIEQIKMIEL